MHSLVYRHTACAILAAVTLCACKQPQKAEVRPAIGQTFSFDNTVGGVKWDCTVLGAENLGKKLTRVATLGGEKTGVGLAPSIPANHLERLHLKITNRGSSTGAMSPRVLTMDAANPDAFYARTVVDQTTTDPYLEPETNQPFRRKDFKPVEPGETREYWEITEVPDALRASAIEWGLDGARSVFVVNLGE